MPPIRSQRQRQRRESSEQRATLRPARPPLRHIQSQKPTHVAERHPLSLLCVRNGGAAVHCRVVALPRLKWLAPRAPQACAIPVVSARTAKTKRLASSCGWPCQFDTMCCRSLWRVVRVCDRAICWQRWRMWFQGCGVPEQPGKLSSERNAHGIVLLNPHVLLNLAPWGDGCGNAAYFRRRLPSMMQAVRTRCGWLLASSVDTSVETAVVPWRVRRGPLWVLTTVPHTT